MFGLCNGVGNKYMFNLESHILGNFPTYMATFIGCIWSLHKIILFNFKVRTHLKIKGNYLYLHQYHGFKIKCVDLEE